MTFADHQFDLLALWRHRARDQRADGQSCGGGVGRLSHGGVAAQLRCAARACHHLAHAGRGAAGGANANRDRHQQLRGGHLLWHRGAGENAAGNGQSAVRLAHRRAQSFRHESQGGAARSVSRRHMRRGIRRLSAADGRRLHPHHPRGEYHGQIGRARRRMVGAAGSIRPGVDIELRRSKVEAMERSFKKEVQALKLGDGETFRGEGILAVTKALLQSGVSYVGGYQGAPVSHLLDVLVDAEDIIGDLGVHLETCTNEASAAAMLGASINYPLRGAVTWKSIVGTNVAADALSNLASPGVIGGVMIILGEDYGEGASVIQERSYAYAMKSSIWLLDPRPDLPTIVRMVEEGFELSEASHAPVMMELRIRACHVTGEFKTKANRRATFSGKNRLAGPPRFDYGRLAHPPVIYSQERLKVKQRLPTAQQFIRARKLNEVIAGDLADVGIIVLGGPHQRRAARAGAARSRRSLLRKPHSDLRAQRRFSARAGGGARVLRRKARRAGGRGSSPDYIEQAVNVELRRADIATRVLGKGMLPRAGEYTSEVLLNALASFLAEARPARIDADAIAARAKNMLAHKAAAVAAVGDIPARPPNFCTGCPERPVFSAIKLMQRELGPTHISADIGCHSFATFAPFSLGNSILGYGMSLASAAAVTPNMDRRPIAVMGDGGFWHNGLITGVASNLFNKGDGVLIVMKNGYASATGQQYLPSSAANRLGAPTGMTIEQTLRSLGVKWLRTVRSYSVAKMTKTLKEAMRTAERGLKVISADA